MTARHWPPKRDVVEALQGYTPSVLTEGTEVVALEEEARRTLGSFSSIINQHFVAVSGGTQAIEVALRSLSIGRGDLVLLPAFTFVGTLLPVLAVGATPLLADVDPRTYNLTPETVEAALSDGTAVDAAIPVHLHGLMADVPALRSALHGCLMIEDACQAYGATFKSWRAGESGDAAAWSLNQTKTVFAGEGGLLCLRNPLDAEVARSLRRFGFEGSQEAVRIGGNWKLPEISARIAIRSLSRLQERLDAAQFAAARLSEALEGVGWLSAPYVPDEAEHVFHKYRVRIEDPDVTLADALDAMKGVGVPACRWGTAALHQHPAFRDLTVHRELPVSEEIPERTLIVGYERAPLCSWDDFEAVEVAERLAEVKP